MNFSMAMLTEHGEKINFVSQKRPHPLFWKSFGRMKKLILYLHFVIYINLHVVVVKTVFGYNRYIGF